MIESKSAGKLTLTVLPGRFAVCQFRPDAPLSEASPCCAFCPVRRTGHELSVVLPEARVPDGAKVEMGWRCLEVFGPLGFDLTGVFASLRAPLARAGVGIFAISTGNTDYILIRDTDLARAREVLSKHRHIAMV